MSKRISLKLTDKNDWLVEAINKEQEQTKYFYIVLIIRQLSCFVPGGN